MLPCTKIKIKSNDDLLLEKSNKYLNVVVLTKSVFNQNHKHYYYHVFLEKLSFKQNEIVIL